MVSGKSKIPWGILSTIALLVLAGAVFIGVQNTLQDPGTTQSKASQSTALTPDDDVLSLQKDLKTLEQNTADEEVNQLYSTE